MLAQYRTLLRVTRALDDGGDAQGEVQRQFRLHQSAGAEQVKFLLSEGSKQLKMISDISDDMLAKTEAPSISSGSSSSGGDGDAQRDGPIVGAGWPWKSSRGSPPASSLDHSETSIIPPKRG